MAVPGARLLRERHRAAGCRSIEALSKNVTDGSNLNRSLLQELLRLLPGSNQAKEASQIDLIERLAGFVIQDPGLNKAQVHFLVTGLLNLLPRTNQGEQAKERIKAKRRARFP